MNVIPQQVLVPPEMQGQRIDIVLAKLFPGYSRSQWSQWLKQGIVTLNGKICKPKHKVVNGGTIHIGALTSVCAAADIILPQAIPLNIIFEDEFLLIINKPAALIMHPGAGQKEHTIQNALLHYKSELKYLPRAGIVHRLDKDTTGLLIVAKTLPTYNCLVHQMQQRQIERQYLALAHGVLVGRGEINTCYGRDPRNRLKMAVRINGRSAITYYQVRKSYKHFTLLEIQLLTGRTHQIRVHMAYINHPIVGDQVYKGKFVGGLPKNDVLLQQCLQAIQRQALHAYRLSFMHPINKNKLNFKAIIPQDFQLLLDNLDNYYA